MKVTAVLLLALASASAGPLSNLKPVYPRNRIIEQSIESRIIGGRPALWGEAPYQVAITLTYMDSSSAFCGGSLISNIWVLTAAHCTKGAESANVYAGSVIWEFGVRRTVPSANIRQHEDFNINSLENDIALLKLNIPLVFGLFIQSIGLPSPTDPYDSYEGQTGIISGWGKTSDPGTAPTSLLQIARATVISNEECRRFYQIIKPSHVCIDTTSGRGTCSGDSGGPLVYAGGTGRVQIGIVSFGSRNGCTEYPNVFTRVSSHRQWLINNT